LVDWIDGWLGDLEVMHDDLKEDFKEDLRDAEYEQLRQRTAALRKTISILNHKAARAEELAGSLNRAEDRLATVEREVTDLRSRLRTANAEISKLRATEGPVAKTSREELEAVSGRLIRTMEGFERRVAKHVRMFARLRPNPLD